MDLKIEAVDINFPGDCNIIFGQSHFIKTVEDIHEAMMSCNASAKFGLAFSEASGARLVRKSGTDDELTEIAAQNVLEIACGHCFLIILRESFPINYLRALREVPEVVGLFCATANTTQAVVARGAEGSSVLGVIDGMSPLGIEDEEGIVWRHDFLRKIGYKL